MLIAEIAAAVVIARPRCIRGAAGLLAPGLIGDFYFGFFALLAGGAVAVQFGVFLVLYLRRFLTLAHSLAQEIAGFLFSFEHDVGFEGLPDMRLQVEGG